MSPMAPRTGSSIMKSMRAATVVARLINTCGVSPALDAPGCVEVLAAAPRLRLRAFFLPDDADGSETRAHYLRDRPLPLRGGQGWLPP